MPRDPFHDYEQDIRQALLKAEEFAHKAHLDKNALSSLESTIVGLKQDLQDVKESIRIVEQSDPSRFGIDESELQRRRKFVRESEAAIARLGLKPAASATTVSSSLAWEQEQQKLLLANQDQALDTIGISLHTLREQAHLIGREADEHVIMLGELDTDVDHTHNRLRGAMQRMDTLVARTDQRLGGWCVWILIAVLLLLLLILVLV